ncbi:hypothetical protein LSH36_92g03005 [Paralvinella palmiformis]|uniref:Uncharacterized protein n=1 Tax=Paralvinella palmiformis TaxID=53620 RepID=A0AAD9K1D7_9ANNE|nr:hypothetical protein LSH36_92g03005 [Paralvinella palmiformis]
MDTLSGVLMSVDLHHLRSQLEHSETRRIQHGVEQIVQRLVNVVGDAEERFHTNEVYGVGSYYSGTKINTPDEFDFLVELAAFEKLGSFNLRSPSFAVYTETQKRDTGIYKKIQLLDEAMIQEWKVENVCVNVGTKTRPVYILDQIAIKNAYYFTIETVWETFTASLPKGFTALNHQLGPGPSLILNLKWRGRKFPHLLVSVDMSLAIHVPNWPEGYDFHKQYPENPFSDIVSKLVTKYGHHLVPCVSSGDWQVPDASWKVSSSLVETRLFNRFPKDSRPLILIRLFKHFKSYCFTLKGQELLPGGYGEAKHDKETDTEIISSYLIKQSVFHMMIKIPLDSWNKDQVGKLFLDLVRFLFKVLQCQHLQDVFNSHNRLSLPEKGCKGLEYFGMLLDAFRNLYSSLKIREEKLNPVFDYLSEIVEDCAKYDQSVKELVDGLPDHLKQHC